MTNKIILTLTLTFALFRPALAQAQETVSEEFLQQLRSLDGGYQSEYAKELRLYKTSFLAHLREIEQVFGEEQCWEEQLLLSGLIAEFDPSSTKMNRILEMNQQIGNAIVSCAVN